MATKDPGDRTPAPGWLRLVQAFVNSIDREHAVDDFAAPSGLAEWFVEHGVWTRTQRVTKAELAEAIELRESLRAVLLAHNIGETSAPAVATLDRMAGQLPLVIRFPTGTLEPVVPGARGAMAQVLAAVQASMADGSWPSLKACKADVCQWAYFDRSHNKSSQWCSMSLCGSRAKMRAYRKRSTATS